MRLAGAAALALSLWVAQAEAACRQALALGLDVSGSVDGAEYRLQLDGLAAALLHPEVQGALFAMPEAPVALAVYEWSGPEAQRVLVPWTTVDGPGALAGVAARLEGTARVGGETSTAIGAAKQFGAGLLAQQPGCWRQVLDVSGDGTSNTGPRPQFVRPEAITINGLVIGPGTADGVSALAGYYEAYVVQGADAFVETAAGFADFEEAMVRKLKRELQVLVVSAR